MDSCELSSHTGKNLSSFDDCQDIVKSLFGHPEINQKYHLAAVNSINWARILAQMTYYFHAYLPIARLSTFCNDKPLRFVVPSGNFGNILVRILHSLEFICDPPRYIESC